MKNNNQQIPKHKNPTVITFETNLYRIPLLYVFFVIKLAYTKCGNKGTIKP